MVPSSNEEAGHGHPWLNDPGLRYLAILDDGAFGDLDDPTRALIADELAWLLKAQLELTRVQLGEGRLPVDVVVCSETVGGVVPSEPG